MMKRYFTVLAVLCLMLSTASRVHATQTALTNLQFLIDNNFSITAGDKFFDNWAIGGPDAQNVDASQIFINPLHDGGLDPGPGLRFSTNFGVLDDEFFTLNISYRVTVLDPNLRIKDNSLSFTQGDFYAVADEDEAFVGIEEYVGSAFGLDDLGYKAVYFDDQGGENYSMQLSDSAEFAQRNEVWVNTQITLFGLDDGDEARLFGWEVRFSQEAATPEPVTAALGLLSLGTLGFAASRRRRA